MSDTPRTDAIDKGTHTLIEAFQLCRQLERELNEAEAALKRLGYEKYGFGWGITIAEPQTKQ